MHHGRVREKPLTAQGVRHLLARGVQLAGLDGDYSPHSIRRGYVTEAGNQGAPPAAAKRLTGHRTWTVFWGVFRGGRRRREPGGGPAGEMNRPFYGGVIVAGACVLGTDQPN